MEDLKKIQEFFSKPLEEGKQLDIEDFAKVVQVVTQTGHPVTVLLTPKFNEIEIITGMNAPDDMLRDLSIAVDSLGYGRNDIIIAGDSSNLSRREYSDIRRVNGGHKDYFEESINEQADHVAPMVVKAYKEYLEAKKEGDGEKAYHYYSKKLNNTYSTRADRDAIEAILKKKYGSALEENKSVANINKHIKAIQIQLDDLGVKYEMSGNPYKPFKAVYKPVNKDDKWYDMFDDIVFRYNLGGVVKTAMNEGAEEIMDAYNDVLDLVKKHSRNLSDDDSYAFGLKLKAWFNKNILSEEKKLTYNDFVRMVKDDMMAGAAPDEMPSDKQVASRAKAYYNDYLQGASVDDLFEATKEEETEFHTKLDKLVHDTFGKRKGEMEEAELTEAYVPSNIAEFAKRRGISPLVRKVAGWAEKVGARITGGTAIGKGYNTLILDLGYQTADIRIDVEDETIELYDEPIYSFADFKNVFMEEVTRQQAEHDEEQLRRERGLEEKAAYIAETIKLGLMLNEELCDKGKRYIAARQAAGEKSSAYLSGRAVRVCKGQIEWPKKGKKK